MTTQKIIVGIIVVLACLPCLMTLHNGPSVLPNIIGLVYSYLLFKYGWRIAPELFGDYVNPREEFDEFDDFDD